MCVLKSSSTFINPPHLGVFVGRSYALFAGRMLQVLSSHAEYYLWLSKPQSSVHRIIEIELVFRLGCGKDN